MNKEKDIIPPPHYHSHEEFQNRLRKLNEIKKLNINPYPHKFTPTHKAKKLAEEFEGQDIGHSDDAASGSTKEVTIAGRVVLFRAMGKNAFGQIQDDTGRIQVMFNRDLTKVDGYNPLENDPKPIKFIEKKIDLGDIVGIEGNLFRTQKNELTIFVKKLTILCKTLLPLPDKHSGLADKGVLYRKRWLDLITNTDSSDRFIKRSKILQIVRQYFYDANFLEVETPVLQNSYGGAQAKPFISHINALSQDMFLRISLEIPLKKLIAGGMDKIFEIGKVFRNEGLDRTHNPEFTLLECYAPYWDYFDLMTFTETLFETIALELFGDTKILVEEDNNDSIIIDLKTPWKRMTMKESIKTYANIDIDTMKDEEIYSLLIKETRLDEKKLKGKTRGSLIANVFEEMVEHYLIQPHHIIDHPIETTPLCKPHRDNKQKDFVERFETFILAREFSNAYSELNDPILQRELLEAQALKKLAGDEEANPLDEEFVEAICQGLPPTGGLGIGIDRLVMLFTNAASIRDVIYFPLMKPED
jgi:lysyl-tRNA synthetase class 2